MNSLEQAAKALANEVWKDVPEDVLNNGRSIITNNNFSHEHKWETILSREALDKAAIAKGVYEKRKS